jgi:uncharacterized membrane protein YfcA
MIEGNIFLENLTVTILTFSSLLFLFSFLAGLLGSLTGLGGGIIVTPVLILLFHVDIHYAMGASLISVIATSSGTATTYLREGYANIRLGVFLETAAVMGAIAGALLIGFISPTLLEAVFAIVLLISAYLTMHRQENVESYPHSHPLAVKLKLESAYPLHEVMTPYTVQSAPLAWFIMGIAGLLSGLLGIGSGTLKVLAMDQVMRLPYKVSTTTSNFMIGITATASAGVYLANGYIQPQLTFPVMLGVLIGAYSGSTLLPHLHTRVLRIIFSFALCFIALQMLYKSYLGAL